MAWIVFPGNHHRCYRGSGDEKSGDVRWCRRGKGGETRLRVIVMFMITASSTLPCIVSMNLVVRVCVNSEHRIHRNCTDMRLNALCHADSSAVQVVPVAHGNLTYTISSTSCRRTRGLGKGRYVSLLESFYSKLPFCILHN